MKKSKRAAAPQAAPRSLAAKIEEQRLVVREDAVQLAMRLRAENTRLLLLLRSVLGRSVRRVRRPGHGGAPTKECALCEQTVSNDAGHLVVCPVPGVVAALAPASDNVPIRQPASVEPAAAPLNEEVKP